MIEITPETFLSEDEIEERFVRAPGPGGQNVNKVSSAVQIRFDAARCAALSDAAFRRLKVIAGSRMTQDGVIVLTAHTHRSQDLNRQDARHRLAEMIRRALIAPKHRIASRPTLASKGRRLAAKKVRGGRDIHDVRRQVNVENQFAIDHIQALVGLHRQRNPTAHTEQNDRRADDVATDRHLLAEALGGFDRHLDIQDGTSMHDHGA